MAVPALALVVPPDVDTGRRWTAALVAAAPPATDRPVVAVDPDGDVDVVLQAADEHAPAVIVLDATVAAGLVWDALARRAPATAVLVVAAGVDAVDEALLSVDAVAAIVVDDDGTDLGRAAWGVLRAEATLAPAAAAALLDVTDDLTDDEREVLELLAGGATPSRSPRLASNRSTSSASPSPARWPGTGSVVAPGRADGADRTGRTCRRRQPAAPGRRRLMAGYSGTPLATKLGIKAGHAVALLGAPAGFADQLEGLPDDVAIRTRAQGRNDVVVSFHTERAHVEHRMPTLVRIIDRHGGLWIAWPKRASKVPTDMTEDVVREVALPLGLVDNKVCAVDEVWSALRVVWRRELR